MAKSRHYNSDNCYIIPLIKDAEREAIILKDDLVGTYHVLLALLKTDEVEDFFKHHNRDCTVMLINIHALHVKSNSTSYNNLFFDRMTVSPDIMRLVDIAYDKAKCVDFLVPTLMPINNLYFLYACLASFSPESVHLIGAWPNIQQDILTYLEETQEELGIISNLESLEMNKIEQEEPWVCQNFPKEENVTSSDVITEEFESFLHEDNAKNLWTEIVILELKKKDSYPSTAVSAANFVLDAYREKFKK